MSLTIFILLSILPPLMMNGMVYVVMAWSILKLYSLFSFSGGSFFSWDYLSSILVMLSLINFLFCAITAIYEKHMNKMSSFFYLILSFVFLLLILSFIVYSFFVFYFLFEVVFMLMFLLISGWGYSFERMQASFYLVFYTLVVSFPFFVFMVMESKLKVTDMFFIMGNLSSYWYICCFVIFLLKLPVYGVHLWLPKAHVEAPVVGSMILAGILLKLGSYGILRFNFILLSNISMFCNYLYFSGLLGGIYGSLLCLRQNDFKLVIAYSSICHMGVFLTGIFSMNKLGTLGSNFMMVSHGISSPLLFFLIYVLYIRFSTRNLFLLKGLSINVNIFMLIMFFSSFLNMGIPPVLSFFSELLIISSAGIYYFFSWALLAILVLLSGLYSLLIFISANNGMSFKNEAISSFTFQEMLVFYGSIFLLIFLILMTGFYFNV